MKTMKTLKFRQHDNKIVRGICTQATIRLDTKDRYQKFLKLCQFFKLEGVNESSKLADLIDNEKWKQYIHPSENSSVVQPQKGEVQETLLETPQCTPPSKPQEQEFTPAQQRDLAFREQKLKLKLHYEEKLKALREELAETKATIREKHRKPDNRRRRIEDNSEGIYPYSIFAPYD